MKRVVLFMFCGVLLAASVQAQEFCPALQRLRADYPAANLTPAQLGDYLVRTVQQTNPTRWVLQRKEGGSACPAAGTTVACDILVDSSTGDAWDVLQDADGAATPDCHVDPNWPHGTPRNLFVYVMPPMPTPPPTPTPDPVPSVDLSPVLTQLSIIEQQMSVEAAKAEAERQKQEAFRQAVSTEYQKVWGKVSTYLLPVLGALAGWLGTR